MSTHIHMLIDPLTLERIQGVVGGDIAAADLLGSLQIAVALIITPRPDSNKRFLVNEKENRKHLSHACIGLGLP